MRPHIGRIVLASAVVVGAWVILVVLTRGESDDVRLAVMQVSQIAAGALLLSGAALRVAAWRVTGTARAAWSAIVLAVAGCAIPLLAIVDRLLGDVSAGKSGITLAHAVVHLILIGLGAAVLLTPAVNSRLHPFRIATPIIGGCLVVLGSIAMSGPSLLPQSAMHKVAASLQVPVMALWAVLAFAFIRVGWRRNRRADIMIGAALFVPMTYLAVRTALGLAPYGRGLALIGFELFGAVILTGLSALALWRLQTGQGTHLLTVDAELRGAQTDLVSIERDQARRLHDARSTILSISGATRLLATPESSNGVDAERLQNLVTVELNRLAGLLDPDFRSANRSFRPVEVIEPLVLAHRLAGGTIDANLPDCHAIGKPEATTTAVANLLSNARTHAVGAHIWVTVTAHADSISIEIADDGPGIPLAEQSLVLQSGVRGCDATAPGSGIGLAAAAAAMSDQGGTLRLKERPGGGTMITLTLRRDIDSATYALLQDTMQDDMPQLPARRRPATAARWLRRHPSRPPTMAPAAPVQTRP